MESLVRCFGTGRPKRKVSLQRIEELGGAWVESSFSCEFLTFPDQVFILQELQRLEMMRQEEQKAMRKTEVQLRKVCISLSKVVYRQFSGSRPCENKRQTTGERTGKEIERRWREKAERWKATARFDFCTSSRNTSFGRSSEGKGKIYFFIFLLDLESVRVEYFRNHRQTLCLRNQGSHIFLKASSKIFCESDMGFYLGGVSRNIETVWVKHHLHLNQYMIACLQRCFNSENKRKKFWGLCFPILSPFISKRRQVMLHIWYSLSRTYMKSL